jgi:FtsZ-interacting cell division protein YlmF
MDAAAAQRLLDFVAGAVDAIDGNAERLGENSFLFTPHQVQVSRMDSAVE